MSECKTCGAPKQPPPPSSPMQYRAHRNSITLSTSQSVPLNRVLISPMAKPNGGWTYSFILGGTQHNINGKKRPDDVAAEVIRLHTLNKTPINVADVWLNLNIYWFTRTDKMHWLTPIEELYAAAEPGAAETLAMTVNNPPQVWGSRAWNFMGIYLAGDNYDKHSFIEICQAVLLLLDPNKNPSIGCQTCYLEFFQQVGLLRVDPPVDRSAAREWLHAFHNQVNRRIGKAEIDFKTAAVHNFWT